MKHLFRNPIIRYLRNHAVLVTCLCSMIICAQSPKLLFSAEQQLVIDAAGRELIIPARIERAICSGSGCLRLLTYLQAIDRIVAVDSIELRGSSVNARPYAIANPQLRNYPLFGEFRGHDSPELIAGLNPQPQVIFKTFAGRGQNPDHLQTKTGIPVITLEYGNLTYARHQLNQALRLMAGVMGTAERAEEVIAFFDTLEEDLQSRTGDIPENRRPSCYIGGLAQSGPHGFQSTEPSFAPFVFTNAYNVAAPSSAEEPLSHANVAKEQIIFWDPQILFVDVSTLQLGSGTNALDQLRHDPAYRVLSALNQDQVYGLFPYNSYNQNFEAIYANAFYIGKVLYPERFEDIDPISKAEEISTFLNGGPAFAALNRQFENLAFSRIKIR